MSEQVSEKLIWAIRRRRVPAVWKNYVDLKKSGQIKKLPAQYHSMTIQSFNLKDDGIYNYNQLRMYQKFVSDIIQAAQENNYKLDTRDYNLLLRLHSRMRDWKAASECWSKMTDKNEESYNIYMRAAIECRQYEQVFKIFDNMQQSEARPDVTTYNLLIETNGRMGNAAEADRLFRDYFTSPVKKNTFWNKLLNTPSHHSAHTSSTAPFFRRIPPSNASMTPTVETFEALLDAHGRLKNKPGLHHIHKTMMPNFNIKMTLKTYEVLIKWYCLCQDMEAAKETFVDMEAKGFKPNVFIFEHLFKHEALKMNRPKVAEAIVEHMKKEYNIRPLSSMYTTLIKIHNKHNREDDANRLVAELQALKATKK